jgi:hypothetical protein
VRFQAHSAAPGGAIPPAAENPGLKSGAIFGLSLRDKEKVADAIFMLIIEET